MSGVFQSLPAAGPFRKFMSMVIMFAMIVTGVPLQTAQANTVATLPIPGTMVQVSAAYEPVLVRGVTIFPDNPLKFNFIVDRGEQDLSGELREAEYGKMAKYFLAALTVPEEELWVNLSPYEKERMIPELFGQTEMGRDLLAQDYILKQLTASLLYPEDELGQRFWKRIYQKAQATYGTTDIPVNTFNKVWIVPEKAVVFERGSSAFVAESRLKVLMEEDYLAQTQGQSAPSANNELAAQMIRELIIPEIEREVNEGEHFAQLRQIYQALILATWYKQSLKESLLSQIYIDQNKVKGVDIADKEEKQKIYARYLQAFRKGVYNYIKEDYDQVNETTVVRQYFSGGAGLQLRQTGVFETTADFAQLSQLAQRNIAALIETDPQSVTEHLENVVIDLREVTPATDAAVMAIDQWRDLPEINIITGGRVGHMNDPDELIAVTNDTGVVVGSMPKSVAHSKGIPHMAVNLYVYDSRGRFLLQRRSNFKIEAQGRLQVGVSGHVDKEETPLVAMLREAQEELGFELEQNRLKRVTRLNEIYREEQLPDGTIRKFVTVYTYQINDEELQLAQANYNLNEISELWLLKPKSFETLIGQHPAEFSRTLRNLMSTKGHSVYHRVLERLPDSAQLASPESRLLDMLRQEETRKDEALITAVERQKEIVAQGYLGFDPVDPDDPPVWLRNVLEFYQATDSERYEEIRGLLRGGFIRVGIDRKEAIDGFTTNSSHIIATNHQQYPEISLIKLLEPEKGDENITAYLKWTVRDSLGNLIGFTAGVIASSVKAFADAGIFELFVDGDYSPTMAGIERYLKAQGKNANKGYLHGVLYTFAKLGWLTRSGRQANDEMSFTLTDKGKQVLGAVSAYAKVAEFDEVALKLGWYLVDESPRDPPEVFSQILGELAALSARGWDLPADMDKDLAMEVRQHLNGYVVGPLLSVMRDRELNIIPKLLNDRRITLTEFAHNQLGLSRLKAAFDMLAHVGFVERDDIYVRMTKKGEANFRRTLNYGVPVSYYPTYALAEELLFGNPADIERYTSEGIETLVDRILNTDGSDKSHEGYFKKVKTEFSLIVENMFAQQRIPTPSEMETRVAAGGQPFTFMISDVGAGKGGFLLNMHDVIMNSDFGQLMRDYPDLYRVVLVGIDFNRAARSNMSNNFAERNIPHIILDGDIGKPQEILETMRVKFEEMQIKPDIMFNIRSMLDHNRQWAQVQDPVAAEAREPISTSVFAYRGELIPNNYLEQNLKEHFEGWAELAEDLLIIELHTLDEDVVAANLSKTLDIPYYVSHLFSDQYIVERPVFMAMAEEAGYDVKTLATYRAEEELATVGIYHFTKRQEVPDDADAAMTGETRPQDTFLEHRTASGQPMLWRDKPTEVGAVIEMLSSGTRRLEDMIRLAGLSLEKYLGLEKIDMVQLPEYDGHDVEVAVLGKQPTNSFKGWIGYGILQEASLNPNLNKIITSTTGNQGIAIAWIAKVLSEYYGRKIEAVIYVGKNTPLEKLAEMSALGATIIGDPREEGIFDNYDDAFQAAEAEAQRLGDEAYYVYHADTAAILSYAALGEAIVEQFVAEGHDLDKSAIFVPVGAGGLASGVAIAAKLRNRNTKIILVQTERTRHAFDSLNDGEMHDYVDEYRDKLDEDGIDTKSMELLAFEILWRLADGLVMVDSTKIQEKIGFKKVHGIKAEGAAVLPYLAMEEISAELHAEGVRSILNVGTGSNISDTEVTVATLLSSEGRLHTKEQAQKYPRDQVVNPGNVMVYTDKLSAQDVADIRALSNPIAGTEPVSEEVIREEGKILLAAKVSAFLGDPSQPLSLGHQLPRSIYMNQKISYVNDEWQGHIGKGPVSVMGVITDSFKSPAMEGKAEVTLRIMVVASGGELLLDGESRLLVDAPEQYASLPDRPRVEFTRDEADYEEILESKEMIITAELLEEMIRVSGNHNPMHLAEDSAIPDQYGFYRQRVAPGLLGATLIAGYARGGRLLEGVYLDEQDFTFLKAVHVGDRVRVRLRVSDIGFQDGRGVRKLGSELEKWDGEKWVKAIAGDTRLLTHEQVSDTAMFGEGKTAVIVDDDDTVSSVTALVLQTQGFTTEIAENGQLALELIDSLSAVGRRVDVVVTDKDMPEMNGVQLVERLKQTHPELPVLMHTGDTTEIEGLRQRLQTTILAKPWNVPDMVAAVSDFFSDEAMTAQEAVGGIDLSSAATDLQIRRDPAGVPLPVNLQPMESLRIEGFIPVIIEITPVYSLPMLLGVVDRDAQPDAPLPLELEPLAQGRVRSKQLARNQNP